MALISGRDHINVDSHPPTNYDDPAPTDRRFLSEANRSKTPVIWPLLVLLILTYTAAALYNLPVVRVIELRLCHEHYIKHDPSVIGFDDSIPEKLCKIDGVQRPLAWIQGFMETTMIVCDFLVTIPLGLVSQRYGVRVVMWLNLVPRIFLSIWALLVGYFGNIFPTKAIIAAPFLFVLGGECVFSSTIFALTAEVNKQYIHRASNFSYISSITYVVGFIGPSMASLTMNLKLWLPFCLSILLLLIAIPTIALLPEIKATSNRTATSPSLENVEDGPLLGPDPASPPIKYTNAFETDRGILRGVLDAFKSLVCLVIGRRNFQLLLVSFVLTALASSDTKLLVQYISKRYEWTFAQAGYLLSAKALVNLTLLIVIVPRIIHASKSLEGAQGSEVRLNRLGAETSIAVSIVGVLCVAVSFKIWMLMIGTWTHGDDYHSAPITLTGLSEIALVIYALGSALPVFTMSLVKSPLIALSDARTHTLDFSIVMLTKTLGSLLGTPLMTALWIQAINLSGLCIGLPYFVSACLYALAAVVISKLQVQ